MRLGAHSGNRHDCIGRRGWFDDVEYSDHAAGVEPDYTPTQGQYLAFIYYYTKIHRIAPAEADIQRYFQTSPPAIH